MRIVQIALVCALNLSAQQADTLFPIRSGRQFGFIDRAGKVVIPPQFDRVHDFSEGLALIYQGARAGYIDRTGKIVIPVQYSTGTGFSQGRALVSMESKYSIIDANGATVAEIPFRVLGEFSAGLAVVQRARGNAPTAYGYIDRNGKVVIEPRFMPAGKFPEDGKGLAAGGLDRHWCYFDRTGKIILRLPMEGHDRAFPFRDGLVRWKEGFYWGYREPTGGWAIPARFDAANDFEDGEASVQLEGKWIRIDTKGRQVEQRKGPRVLKPYADGLALAADGDRLGYLNPDGAAAFPFRKYDKAFSFSDGRARIRLDGRFGYLDRKGNLAIPNIYADAADFRNGLASVLTAEGMAYIDTEGKVVWKSESRF